MAIDATLPAYLAQRAHWTDPTVSRDLQAGANLYHQSQQERRMQRAQQMQEEVKRLALEEKEHVAEGTVAITKILSEMAKTGGYNDPALKSQFWDAVSNNPKFGGSQAFKDIMDTFQYAEQAKARSEMESLRQQSITDRSESAIQSRFDLLGQRIDGMAQMEDLKQENREALTTLRSDLNILRDSLKPTRTGQLVHDLTETDLVALRSELSTLDNIFKEGKLKGTKKPGMFNRDYTETPEAEYERRKQEILKKYDAKRVGTPKPAESAPASDKRVRVVSPSGKVGNIPESQLEEALKQGYKPAP